jgi:hypothetical protein
MDDMDVLFGNKGGGISWYLLENEKGLILFTIRSIEVAVSVAVDSIIELHDMDQHKAKSFLDRSLLWKDLLYDKATVTELLEELTYLPLAITQAIAYLNRNQVSIAEYLTQL